MKNSDIYTNRLLWIRILFFSFIFISLSIQCEIQKDFEYEYSNTDGKLNMTAWEFIQKKDSLSLMEEAIKATGLKKYYSGSTEYTFIVPSNKAWRAYLENNGYSQITEVPLPILKNVLLYHIVKGKILFTDPDFFVSNSPITRTTENGQKMHLSRNGTYRGVINMNTNNSWTIQISNLEPTNGALHISPSVVFYSAITGNTEIPDVTIDPDTLYAINDTYINGGSQKDNNFGFDPILKVKNVDGSGDYDRKAFLMFDLKDIDTSKGILREAFINIDVKFTQAKSLVINLHNVSDTTWSETSMTWNNAPIPDAKPFSSIVTSKLPTFSWNCTDYIATNLESLGKISIMVDCEAGGNETNELGSKENMSLAHPTLITTYSSGISKLSYGTNTGISVANKGAVILSKNKLEMKGAQASDIIYTLEVAPSSGWLIKGNEILNSESKFNQLDINVGNILYIHSGLNKSDSFTVSVKDKDGGIIDPFNVSINVK